VIFRVPTPVKPLSTLTEEDLHISLNDAPNNVVYQAFGHTVYSDSNSTPPHQNNNRLSQILVDISLDIRDRPAFGWQFSLFSGRQQRHAFPVKSF
jgi:hypothetical protein